MARLGVQFLDYQDERSSPVYGPFNAVQVTYNLLRGENDDDLATYTDGLWTARDKATYSDFVVNAFEAFPHPDAYPAPDGSAG